MLAAVAAVAEASGENIAAVGEVQIAAVYRNKVDSSVALAVVVEDKLAAVDGETLAAPPLWAVLLAVAFQGRMGHFGC